MLDFFSAEVVSSEVASASELSSDLSSASEQKQEPVTVELCSDVSALGARLTAEVLSRCSPIELGFMHEQLICMMRSIVDLLLSRLVDNLVFSLLCL